MQLIPTIGLEIHAELKTRTKMFCRCKNDSGETRPNQNVCPVCMAHPGALPVINKEAVRSVLRVGAAVGGTLADYTEFDRKNYFYPDLPKGYQISQYDFPLVSGGSLKGVALTRIHLEEDTASSIHDEKTGATVIDYNRGGVPLMELVTEPVIRSAEEAGAFARELQLLLRYLGVSEANMEKGEMRVEANISVAEEGKRGTKVEIKNINSFNFMERAIAYEIKRQTAMIERGEIVLQETRGWNDAKQETFSQRVKEGSADYRYFPDPDLPSLRISELSEFNLDSIKKTLPVLPEERRRKYLNYGLTPVVAEQFVSYPRIGNFFDLVVTEGEGDSEFIKRSANYIANDLVRIIRDIEEQDTVHNAEISISRSEMKDSRSTTTKSLTNEVEVDMKARMNGDARTIDSEIISSKYFATLMRLVEDRKLTSRSAKDVLLLCIKERRDPSEIARENGLILHGDGQDIENVVRKVINENVSAVADYRAGKESALQFLVGQGMRVLKGAVDPLALRNAIIEALK